MLGRSAFTVSPQALADAVPVNRSEISVSSLADLAGVPDPAPVATALSGDAPIIHPPADAAGLALPNTPPITMGYYRDAQPAPTVAPASTRFDLPAAGRRGDVTFSPVLDAGTGFAAQPIGADAQAATPVSGSVSVPMRLGHVRLQTHADAGQARSDALAYSDTSMGGGATFDARLGKWQRLGVDVSSYHEHVTVDQPVWSGSSVDGSSNFDLANNTPVFIPAYADITKQTLSAGLAVPVSQRMVASLRVDSQHLFGGYGVPGLANLDANNMIYGARLTYQLKGSSAISFSAQQFRFQDNLIPTNAFSQTSANLNLTVKF
jgi:hypothetical protein